MAVTARELAKILGISPSTISMVCNGKPGISEQTRRRILQAAEEYGFDIVPKKTGIPRYLQFVIYKKHGSVVADTPFFSRVIEGIEGEAFRHGYLLQVSYFYENKSKQEQLAAIAGTASAGIVILGTEMEAADLVQFEEMKLPMVLLDSYFEEKALDTIAINNAQGAYLATRELIDAGHRKIGYLRSKVKINNFTERADGFFRALRRSNLPAEQPFIYRVDSTMEGAYEDFKEILRRRSALPTAFFADNDIIAAACIRALKENGYSVPESISVIGFDDTPLCDIIEPALTTMRVPKERLGALAVKRLVDRIEGRTEEQIKIEVATTLVRRASVARLD